MARYLPETLESILTQDYPHVEVIVIDAGSTDETPAILASYGDRIRTVVGPDKGPSDAAHKGFQLATGDIFAWLNTDDTFLPGAVRTAVDYLTAHPEIDVVYGEGWWIDDNGAIISRYPTLPWDARVLERDCFICQPAAFIRASAYRRCGLDPDINRSFDYDLWIRMAKQGIRFAAIPDYLANSRMHTGAKTIYEREAVFQASMDLLQRHYGYIPLPWIFGYTTWRRDGRDQFFAPLRPTVRNYLASLPMGLRLNPANRTRFVAEWFAAPLRKVLGRRP
ncbi:MAG: glycosyl transferase, family 2 [Candidatus Solibacter sp.]|nr:glycosyl transferase, family 2 [Candidatus Solibacter sp.]